MGTNRPPSIYQLAHTTLNPAAVKSFLQHHEVEDWDTDALSDAEKLIEICGRRCYKSFETDTHAVSESNPNLTRVREGNREYIANILNVKHGSVVEHAHVTFAIEDITRVFTHEIVRHRLCNFSQESLRFVRPTQLNYYFPDVFKNLPNTPIDPEFINGLLVSAPDLAKHLKSLSVRDAAERLFTITISKLETVQATLVGLLGMDESKKLFGDKKKLQSAMRRLMPIGMTTGIIVTTNLRNWRHMIEMRTSPHAEEEIQQVFYMIFQSLRGTFPATFQDAEVDPDSKAVHFDNRI